MSELGIKPDEFWRYTPAEVSAISEGNVNEQKREWQRTARITMILASAFSKKRQKWEDHFPFDVEDDRDPEKVLPTEDQWSFLKSMEDKIK